MVDTHLLVAAVRKTQGTHKVQKNALSKKHDGAGHRLGEGEGGRSQLSFYPFSIDESNYLWIS